MKATETMTHGGRYRFVKLTVLSVYYAMDMRGRGGRISHSIHPHKFVWYSGHFTARQEARELDWNNEKKNKYKLTSVQLAQLA